MSREETGPGLRAWRSLANPRDGSKESSHVRAFEVNLGYGDVFPPVEHVGGAWPELALACHQVWNTGHPPTVAARTITVFPSIVPILRPLAPYAASANEQFPEAPHMSGPERMMISARPS